MSSFDPKSLEIAEHFLEPMDSFKKLPQAKKDKLKNDLAESIQGYIEDWITFEVGDE